MSELPYSTLFEEALEAWEDTRRGVIEEAEVIPDDLYDWRPSPDARSFEEILRHLLEAGLMGVGELARDDGDFTRQGYQEFLEEHAGDLPADLEPRALRERLRSSHEEGSRMLRERGELHMLQMIRRFDGLPGTRFAWFQHLVAHESYHRGQIALYVRQMGRVPALTQRISEG